MKINNYISFFTCCLLCYILFRVVFLQSPWKKGTFIGSDVSGYYSYLPAYFIYDDLTQLKFIEEVEKKYPSVHRTWSVASNGNRVQKYPIGMSILYAPAFGTAHFFAGRWGFEKDGYSFPYQYFLAMYGVLFACMGLWFLRACLNHYFEDWLTALTLFILVMSSNLFIYAGLSTAMPHVYLFTLYAILIWLTLQWHQSQKWYWAASIGLVYGWMIIARPTEVIALLIPLLWSIYNRQTLEEKIALVWRKKGQVFLLSAITIGVGMIQLGYWKMASGDWLYYSYEEQGFSFLDPYLIDGLFSYKKGWLIYTPIMIFAIGGFWQLWKKKESLFLAFFSFFLLNIYIIYSWDIWWYGGSVGSRAVVQSYAILAFPLAAFIGWIFLQKRIWLLGWSVMVLIFTDLNLMQAWQSHSEGGGWNAEYMTRAYYFSIIGSTQFKPEYRKYLDVGRRIKDTEGMNFQQLYFDDFETVRDSNMRYTSNHKFGGQQALQVDAQNQTAPLIEIPLSEIELSSEAWIRAGLQVFYTNREWGEWKMTSLVMQFWRGGELIESRPLRLQWLANPWQWHHAYFERPLPRKMRGAIQADDLLKVYIQTNGSSKAIYIDNFEIEVIEP